MLSDSGDWRRRGWVGGVGGSGLTTGEQRGAHCMDFSRILYLSPVSSGTQERDKHEPNHTQNVAQENWQKHSHTPVVKRTEEHSCKQLRETETHTHTHTHTHRQMERETDRGKEGELGITFS